MYITVRFGEKEENIFNPNCRCVTLLNTIREKCQCEWDLEVDLSDESGNIKNLREYPHKYASDMLNEREKLVLIRIDRRDTGDAKFVPLLNDTETLTDTFFSQLASREKRPSSGRRHIKSSRSRNGTSPTKGGENKGTGPAGNKGSKTKEKAVHRTNSKSNK